VRLKDKKKSIILGNRGSGKSAIIKMLAEYYKRNNTLVIELTPEDYSYEMLQRTMVSERDGSWAKTGAYTAAWKYLIYVLAMKSYFEDNKIILKSTSKKIFNYLRDNHKVGNKNYWDVFLSYLNRIEGIKVGQYEAGLKKTELQQLYKLEELTSLLGDLKILSERKPIIFLIDELDKGWDATEDAKAFIGGLFQAAISINQLSENFSVIVSLRKELYDNIPALYDDFQKYNDIFEVIEWDNKSLLKLIAKRIGHSLPEFSKLSSIEKWRLIFKEEICQMDSFEYVVGRSLYRPREIIQFCIEARDRAVEKRSNKIDTNSIVTSEIRYSEKRTKDIATEYKTQYPNLLDIFEAFRGFYFIMERHELENICSKILLGEIKTRETSWLFNQTEEFLITILWQIGFLNIYTNCYINGKQSEGYYGCHQIGQSNIGNIQKFMIHPMFRMFLGITESLTASRKGEPENQ
jgi:energy-coupling factor transporter ATP-binding protein EcfA2